MTRLRGFGAERGQIEQGPIVSAGQRSIQPCAQLIRVDLTLLGQTHHESADHDPAPGLQLTFAMDLESTLARIVALLAKLQLREAILKGRYLFIEFRHVSHPLV
jgi:hypothetical protein